LTQDWEKGGEGGVDLASQVREVLDQPQECKHLYDLELPIDQKIDRIVKEIYSGERVDITAKAQNHLEENEANRLGNVPVCMAKSQYSLSDDPKKLGRPEGFTVTVRELNVKAGAGFVVALTGDIMTMPGLPKTPSAVNMDVDAEGNSKGLF